MNRVIDAAQDMTLAQDVDRSWIANETPHWPKCWKLDSTLDVE